MKVIYLDSNDQMNRTAWKHFLFDWKEVRF